MNTGRIFISDLSVMVPTLRTIMNSSYYYEYRENIHLGLKCYGTYLTDYNELFLLLWIPGEYSSQPHTLVVRLTFNTLLSMVYLYFHSIYLFHVIPSLCLSSRPFTNPQQLYFPSAITFFFLVHKLILLLWSSHIFTQWGWLILFCPDHFSWAT